MGVVERVGIAVVAPREMNTQSSRCRSRCMHWEVHFDPWLIAFFKMGAKSQNEGREWVPKMICVR